MFDNIANALSNPIILGVLALLLVGLIGLMIFMRMKKSDD